MISSSKSPYALNKLGSLRRKSEAQRGGDSCLGTHSKAPCLEALGPQVSADPRCLLQQTPGSKSQPAVHLMRELFMISYYQAFKSPDGSSSEVCGDRTVILTTRASLAVMTSPVCRKGPLVRPSQSSHSPVEAQRG